jgi:hypothetical protein
METVDHFNIAGHNLYIKHSALIKPFASIGGFSEFYWEKNSSQDNGERSGEGKRNIIVNLNANFSHEELSSISSAKLLYEFESDNMNSSFYINCNPPLRHSHEPDEYLTDCMLEKEVQKSTEHILTIKKIGKEALVLISKGDTHYCNWEQNRNPVTLRFALWVAYGISSLKSLSLPIHSSAIVYNGKTYIFLGESGTGKSTHTSLWKQYLPGSLLLNDDSPIVSVVGDKIYVSGSPWSGKTPCYLNKTVPLGAVIRLSQAPYNKATKLSKISAIAALLPSTPPAFQRDPYLQKSIYSFIDKIICTTPVYSLECLPDTRAVKEILHAMRDIIHTNRATI